MQGENMTADKINENARLTVTMPLADKRKLEAMAKQQQRSESFIVRQAMTKLFQEKRK